MLKAVDGGMENFIMNKIFAILISALMIFAVVSCAENTDIESKPENEGENTEQTVTPDVQENVQPENEPAEEGNSSTEGALDELSYESFKKIIGYSMYPYDIPVQPEKNMVNCVSGYNGEVELTYFSFVLDKNAATYFDEIKSYFPDQVVMSEEDGEYEICKMEDGEFYYTAVRIGKTIIYGSCKDGYDAIDTWLYGLGYITKE